MGISKEDELRDRSDAKTGKEEEESDREQSSTKKLVGKRLGRPRQLEEDGQKAEEEPQGKEEGLKAELGGGCSLSEGD